MSGASTERFMMNSGMRPLVLTALLLLLLPTSAAADDYYVPLGRRTARTDLRITNPSPARTTVAIELLGDATREIELDAGQSMHWNDVVAGLFGSESAVDFGALRIGADTALDVTAASHRAASMATLPVLDAAQAVEEGGFPMRKGLPWRSGLLVVNPGDGVAVVILTVHRGEEVVDQSLWRIPARAVQRVSLEGGPHDRLTFRSPQPVLLFGYDTNEHTGARVFTAIAPNAAGSKRRSVRSGSPPAAEPQTIVLTPSKDNTLFQSANGTLSNGAGVHLFAGATASGSLRRALLAFDVASQIPPGSRITRATLQLEVSLTIAGPERMTLHRVSADWGEGSSNAGASRDGVGVSSRAGDATWVHRFFLDQRWITPGGDFTEAPDASAMVDRIAVWESSGAMVARVQGWLDQPSANFGWIIIGNESRSTTAKRFNSREGEPRPTLTIEFVR
jgi:hypothetical protein